MVGFLAVWGGVMLMLSVTVGVGARNSFGVLEMLLLVLIATVAFGFAGVIHAIHGSKPKEAPAPLAKPVPEF